MIVRALVGIGILCAALGASAESGEARPAAHPRATMHRVFDAVVVLVPLSLDEERFRARKEQPAISREIHALAGAARALEQHAAGRDRSFRFLAASLAKDVEEILHSYNWGRYEEARLFVLESTRNCVACHQRLPSGRDFPLAEELLARIDMASLSPHERGQLYLITRQFGRALDTWESLFRAWLVSPELLASGGYLQDYLTVAIRVEGTYTRARSSLEELRGREGLDPDLREQLGAWIRDLRRFEQSEGLPADLAGIQKIIDQAPEGEGMSTVSDLVASAALFRFLDARDGRPGREKEVAEAYYLLGLVEARGTESMWVPQVPFHLELSIRLDPKGPRAAPALALLEQHLQIGYGVLDEEVLPRDLWTSLVELRRLVKTAK